MRLRSIWISRQNDTIWPIERDVCARNKWIGSSFEWNLLCASSEWTGILSFTFRYLVTLLRNREFFRAEQIASAKNDSRRHTKSDEQNRKRISNTRLGNSLANLLQLKIWCAFKFCLFVLPRVLFSSIFLSARIWFFFRWVFCSPLIAASKKRPKTTHLKNGFSNTFDAHPAAAEILAIWLERNHLPLTLFFSILFSLVFLSRKLRFDDGCHGTDHIISSQSI